MQHTPKKSLGQNFLKDPQIVKRIVESTDLKSDDFVLEVGPGQGVMTRELAKFAKKVVAVEIDRNLAEMLKEKYGDKDIEMSAPRNKEIGEYGNMASPKYASRNNIEIIEGDILEINLPELLIDKFAKAEIPDISRGEKFRDDRVSYKVIANIPYYITSPIIRLFLETKIPPREMILMVQKEVAERIVAKPGEMSILAISVQYYANAELLFNVPRTAFYPEPDVDSAVIRISRDKRQETRDKDDAKKFFRIVKAGFCAKRKTLANNLSNSLHLDKKEIEEKIVSLGYKPTTRAQELSVDDWKKLVEIL